MIYVFEITDKPSRSKAQILFDSGKSDDLENGKTEIRGEGEAKRKTIKLFKTDWPGWAAGIGSFTIGERALRYWITIYASLSQLGHFDKDISFEVINGPAEDRVFVHVDDDTII